MAIPDLIPRDVLFGHSERTAPVLSPDGTRIAFLAPHEDTLAVWVRTLGADDARVVAFDRQRPIRNVEWAPDGERVLYLQDTGGDENFHLFAADTRGGTEPVDLTPGTGARVSIQALDPNRPDRMLIAWNVRDARVFDVYALDPRTGACEMHAENPGAFSAFEHDAQMVVRAAVTQRADASAELLVRDGADAPWRTLATYLPEDDVPRTVAFTPDGAGLYAITSAGANAARLVRYDVATGERAEIVADPEYDVIMVQLATREKTPVAAAIVRERVDWAVLDASYADDFATLREHVPGDVKVVSTDRDDRRWIVVSNVDAGSPSFWLYDRGTRHAEMLFFTRPALEQYTLAPMTPVSYAARDGLVIHGYLTRPPGAPAGPLPAIVFVHGGPWARDVWGFNAMTQWLANRGYAVLQPNFRGSVGYGKAHLNAGDREWAGAMHTDLLDAKAWLVDQGIADAARVGVLGGSYGGYATLAALAFSPETFACGVDIVGPSNLNTLLASIPPYWETLRATFTARMGEDEAFLREQSPLFKADAIRAPLLIAQGANDPRVKIAESDQIVQAMRRNGQEVAYIVFDDEGHGFERPANNKRFLAAAEAFLAQHLGGRAEPAAEHERIEPHLR